MGAKVFVYGENVPAFVDFTKEEAIRILQINERGRQGKMRAKYMKDIKLQAKRENDLGGNEDYSELNEASTNIQRVYRGYKARKLYSTLILIL